MQAFIIVRNTAEGITTSHFNDVFTAINHAEALPEEAHARVFGICSTHGIEDFSDGYCATCHDEFCQIG